MPIAFCTHKCHHEAQGTIRSLWMSLETHVCQHLLTDSHQVSWSQVEYRGPEEWLLRTCSEQMTGKEAQAPKALLCCTSAPLETPAGLKLSTHLAHITSYPSKIFHYHSTEDIKGTVIARTLQDWLSTLSAARVGKSPVCGCIWWLLSIFLFSLLFLQRGLIMCRLWPHPCSFIDR